MYTGTRTAGGRRSVWTVEEIDGMMVRWDSGAVSPIRAIIRRDGEFFSIEASAKAARERVRSFRHFERTMGRLPGDRWPPIDGSDLGRPGPE